MIYRRFTAEVGDRPCRVVFRTPRISDAEGSMRTINSLVREKAYIRIQKTVSLKQEKQWLREQLKSEGRNKRTIFVEVDGAVKGSSRVERGIGAESHVCTLGISLHRDVRGSGLGKALMGTLLETGKRMGCTIAYLSCYQENRPAFRLYKKMGFAICGRIPNGRNHYGRYLDEVIMVRPL